MKWFQIIIITGIILLVTSSAVIANSEFFVGDKSNGIGLTLGYKDGSGTSYYSGTFCYSILGSLDFGFGYERSNTIWTSVGIEGEESANAVTTIL